MNIVFTRREFEALLEEKDYSRSDSRNQRTRRYTCFQSGEWQRKVTEKLWSKKISHGFHFKNHKVSFVTNTAFFEDRVSVVRKSKVNPRTLHATLSILRVI